ncbi:unnamed protein product [Effrenium voratum]|uniref:Uncharacterized protein n=1 Tax=Effrenium voratum TaxID=2562239 RepID=A0AA36HS88_9DINO|nr:unnamed protein product [Effrenium voratum]
MPRKTSSKDKVQPDAGLFALLLNTTTKDEGEEFLDYAYPSEHPDLKAILPMKGVLLASCGVMKAAVGQEVNFLLFRSLTGQEYKVSMKRLERWILCIVLPAATTDACARQLVDEALALVLLRFGRLQSADFRQLEPIFKAMSSVLASHSLYSCSGQLQWHPLAEDWKQVVEVHISKWEQGWQESAPSPALAVPQGFALLLEQQVMATSLNDEAFSACARLLALEGEAKPASDDLDVRCHSLFLTLSPGGMEPLPSHQYSLLQRGPWLFFVLWNMSDTVGTSQTPRVAADPFGIDISLELLTTLPLPPGHTAAERQPGLSPSFNPPSRSGHDKRRSSFGLPCLFKTRTKSAEHLDDKEVEKVCRPQNFCHALELRGEDPRPPGSFSTLQEPRRISGASIPQGVRCPVLGQRLQSQRPSEWGSAELADFPMADLDWLWRCYAARRAAWREGPGAVKRHILVDILRGDHALDKLWKECLEGSDLGKDLEQEVRGKKTEATLLGSGEPWRFQDGAPYRTSDLTALVSVGVLQHLRGKRAWLCGTVCGSVAPAAARWDFETLDKILVLRLPSWARQGIECSSQRKNRSHAKVHR